MTTAMHTGTEVADYIAAVRTHLGDLPADEREEVLDDLEAHLTEVAAESGTSLAQQLGSPDAYAAELRASAGYEPVDPEPTDGLSIIGRLDRRWTVIRQHQWVRPVLEFLPELRSGWWVVRGAGAVVLWAIVVDGDGVDLPIPSTFGGHLPTLALMVAAVVVSVRLGRRAANGRRRKIAVLANVAIGAALVVALLTTHPGGYRVEYIDNGQPPFEGYLQSADGRPIFNVYPFAADGTPLAGVLLYDQDGIPLDNLQPVELYNDLGNPVAQPVAPVDGNGNPITNAFPKSLLIPTASGAPRPDRRPTVAIPPPAPATSAPATSAAP